jgi:CRISPR-associated protein Cas2
MPFTVITLKRVPNALRGDLTRWMQEIATGVYVGNYNSKVREYLWERVKDTVGDGEATLCFSCRNEIGYSFNTYNTQRQIIDYDGIPIVLIPEEERTDSNTEHQSLGFSNAKRYYQANKNVRKAAAQNDETGKAINVVSEKEGSQNIAVLPDRVFVDIETTGLDVEKDNIIEIGAIKISGEQQSTFHRLIKINTQLQEKIKTLTGISDDMLKEGTPLESSLNDFITFIHGTVLVGYNITFDFKFIDRDLRKISPGRIQNKKLDLMREAKKRNSFQNNYKFETTLKEFGINKKIPHRAVEDARLIYELYLRMGFE